TRDLSGAGQGIIVLARNNVIADAANPVSGGDAITIYCTGLGQVDPPVVAGAATPFPPLSLARSTVSVTIGGALATVLFAGLTPGFAQLYQVNAIVPRVERPGPAVDVVLRVDPPGVQSRAVTIGVK